MISHHFSVLYIIFVTQQSKDKHQFIQRFLNQYISLYEFHEGRYCKRNSVVFQDFCSLMSIAWLSTRHQPTICSHQVLQGLKKERKNEWLIKFTTLQSAYLLEIQIRFSRSTLQNLKLTVPLAIHVKSRKFKAKENKTNLKAKITEPPPFSIASSLTTLLTKCPTLPTSVLAISVMVCNSRTL